MDSAMFQLMRSAEQAACDLKRLLDMEALSSQENRQGHQMNRELLEKVRMRKGNHLMMSLDQSMIMQGGHVG
jgi:hypothetical protein